MVKVIGNNNSITCSEIVNSVKPRVLSIFINKSILVEDKEKKGNMIERQIIEIIKKFGFVSFKELSRGLTEEDIIMIEKTLLLLVRTNGDKNGSLFVEEGRKNKQIKKIKQERDRKGNNWAGKGFLNNCRAMFKDRNREFDEIYKIIFKEEEIRFKRNSEKNRSWTCINQILSLNEGNRTLTVYRPKETEERKLKRKEYQISFNFNASNHVDNLKAFKRKKVEEEGMVTDEKSCIVNKVKKQENSTVSVIEEFGFVEGKYDFEDFIKKLFIKQGNRFASFKHFLDDFFILQKNRRSQKSLINLIKCENDSFSEESYQCRLKPTSCLEINNRPYRTFYLSPEGIKQNRKLSETNLN